MPSAQKLVIPARAKPSNNELLDNFEPDEKKLNEIENNIFNKISESVEKIFSIPIFEPTRLTFNSKSISSKILEQDESKRLQSVIEKGTNRKNSIEDRFKEIEEADEEDEERATFLANLY